MNHWAGKLMRGNIKTIWNQEQCLQQVVCSSLMDDSGAVFQKVFHPEATMVSSKKQV